MIQPKEQQLALSLEDWNDEDAADLTRPASHEFDIVVFSRDWTVETIVRQIEEGNIDLDPDFQRRNAWRDARRSRLIESFILNFPVPQIVLAEHPSRKKSYIVIDGKQRLMTIAGLFLPKYRDYWEHPQLSDLEVLPHLNGVEFSAVLSSADFANERRQLQNADIRTTVISAFKSEDVLYDIFYRLNTGSVPLSSQELRQVLHRGPFSQYLLQVTDKENPLWPALGQDRPDPRLRDVELLLRLLALNLFSQTYVGNMKPFLDETMGLLNREWAIHEGRIQSLVQNIFEATEVLCGIFGPDQVGRRFRDGKYLRGINRAIFEVQAFFLQGERARLLAKKKKTAIKEAFEQLCTTDLDFVSSIESTTKSIENYRTRFQHYRAAASKALGMKLPQLPLAA